MKISEFEAGHFTVTFHAIHRFEERCGKLFEDFPSFVKEFKRMFDKALPVGTKGNSVFLYKNDEDFVFVVDHYNSRVVTCYQVGEEKR